MTHTSMAHAQRLCLPLPIFNPFRHISAISPIFGTTQDNDAWWRTHDNYSLFLTPPPTFNTSPPILQPYHPFFNLFTSHETRLSEGRSWPSRTCVRTGPTP